MPHKQFPAAYILPQTFHIFTIAVNRLYGTSYLICNIFYHSLFHSTASCYFKKFSVLALFSLHITNPCCQPPFTKNSRNFPAILVFTFLIDTFFYNIPSFDILKYPSYVFSMLYFLLPLSILHKAQAHIPVFQ